jgi:hypothetical protein
MEMVTTTTRLPRMEMTMTAMRNFPETFVPVFFIVLREV